MNKKLCKRCSKIKPIDEFSIRRSYKDGKQSNCKECCVEMSMKYYKKNKKKYMCRAKERRKFLKKMVRDLKSKTPCKDCGIQYPPYVMEFDHLPGYVKKYNMGDMFTRNISFKKVNDEIAKCDIVCSNCHRQRTFTRRPYEL